MLKKIVRQLMNSNGWDLDAKKKLRRTYVMNIFSTASRPKVLLSYLVRPFTEKIDLSHTALRECYTAAEIFHKLGYQVDAVDLNACVDVDFSQYQVLYGMGDVFEHSFHSAASLRKIFYATGCNPIFSNTQTVLSVREFQKKHGLLPLDSSRLIGGGQHCQILLSDSVIVLGNEFVLQTYRDIDPQGVDRYQNLDAFFYQVIEGDCANKDFVNAKKHFLWFGSMGLVHKGLGLLLDIFAKRPDIVLHVCGASRSESVFYKHYQSYLDRYSNIQDHGFVRLESQEFAYLMNQCGFVLNPSVSEGGSPAILNVVGNGGLIPIISRSSGLSLDDYGWIVDSLDEKSFMTAIDQALSKTSSELMCLAAHAQAHVRGHYTYECYQQNLEKQIRKSLEGLN